jgi:hypothetical protein
MDSNLVSLDHGALAGDVTNLLAVVALWCLTLWSLISCLWAVSALVTWLVASVAELRLSVSVES